MAKLYEIQLDWKAGEGVPVTPRARLSNEVGLARDLLAPIASQVGLLELEQFQEGTPFVYARHVRWESDVDTLLIVNNYLILLQMLATGLWLVKDNSVNAETGFAYALDEADGTVLHVSANHRAVRFSNARGETGPTAVSKAELTDALALLEMHFGDPERYVPLSRWDVFKTRPGELPPDRHSNRLERAWYELQRARSLAYVPSKIAGYCTVLEALLSTDGMEISHKIAERSARLLGRDLEERLSIFRTVKQAYGIRSRNVHGGIPPRNLDQANEVSCALDDVVRRLLNKAIRDAETRERLLAPDEELERWLIEQTLA